MRVIAIEIHGPNDFTVRELERYQDHLCWDEMLGTIAELTHPKIGQARFRMLTREEHAAWRASLAPMQHPTYAEPPLLEGPKAAVKLPERMSGKHTPTPWEWIGNDLEHRADDWNDVIHTEVSCGAFCYGGTVTLKISEADKRLIAAAPDLLDVLLELTDIEGPLPGTRDWHAKATAAIAKARGEA